MTSHSIRAAAAVLILGGLLVSSARAQEEAQAADEFEITQPAVPTDDVRARELFEQGAAAYAAGHYDAALGFFEESYALSGRGRLLFNIGTSADRLRQNEKALENYEAYLAAVPDATNAPEVTTRVRVLREEIEQQRALEASLSNLEAENEVDRSRRRRRRWIGGIAGAVLVIGGAVLIGVLASGDRFDDYDGNVIQTLGSSR